MGLFDFLRPRKANSKPMRHRSYAAANTGRLFADFNASSRSADSEMKPAIVILRDRSRDLARNDPYARRFFNLIKVNVVGETGFNLQVKARNADKSLDTVGNDIVEFAWEDWCRTGNCTADGKMSWVDVQKYVAEAEKRDGEAFIQIVRSSKFKYGFALNLIEADLIDDKKNERLQNGNEIRLGVEVDGFRRPVAYWVKQAHPGDFDYTTMANTQSIRIPAASIIHVYNMQRAGQTRGEPALAPVMTSLKMLNAHREAELVASRMAAAKMGFFTSDTGDDFNADDYDGTVPIIDAEPGTFHQLPAGVDFKPFDPTHPSTAFAEFQKGILRSIASGLGVSYASISNDLEGTSYSSVRQGALEERDNYRLMQKFMIDHLAMPVFGAWLQHVMEFNFIPLPVTKFDKFYNNTIFRGRGFSWVDPQKEMNASVIGLQNGILSLSDIAAQYGRDTEEVFSSIQRDQELADSYGLSLAFQPFGGNEQMKGVDNTNAGDVTNV